MANNNNTGRRRGGFPGLYLAAALAASAAASYLIFSQARAIYVATSESHTAHYGLLESVSGLLVLDSRMTLAAGQAAAAGDARRREEYERLAEALNIEIKRVGRLAADTKCARYSAVINETNLNLAELERKALRLAGDGRRKEAVAMLTGRDYLELKKAYGGAVMGMMNEFEALHVSESKGLRRQIARRGAAAAVLSGLALLLWGLSASAVFRWMVSRVTAEEMVARKEEEFRHFFDTVQEVFYRADWHGRLTDITPSIRKYSGYTREELLGLPITSLYQNPEARKALLKLLLAKGMVEDYEVKLRTKDRGVLDVLVNARLIKGFGGLPVGIEGSLRDITARKTAEKKLERMNRLYDIMCRVTEALLRGGGRKEIFDEICRIAVESGGIKFAWVGVMGADKGIEPISAFGAGDAYLEKTHISADPAVLEGQGPTGVALRERRVVINSDTAKNPLVEPWRDRMLELGFRSTAAFPAGEGCVVTMYAGEAGFFMPEEERLLRSLSEDLTYALSLPRPDLSAEGRKK